MLKGTWSIFLLMLILISGQGLHAQREIKSLLHDAKKLKGSLDFPQAIKTYKQVLELDVDNASAQEGLIDIYLYRYEIFDSAATYIDKRLNNVVADTNDLVFFHQGNCLRMQERHYEAIDAYLVYKKITANKGRLKLVQQEIDENLESCRYAIKNQQIVNDNTTYTVQNMDFFINSVDSEYTPVFLEGDSLLLYNARYKDFETEEITIDNKYYENIYYFDLEESVASSYNPGIKQDNHHAVIGTRYDNNDILVFYKNKIWLSSIDKDRLNEIEPLPKPLSNFYFQPHGVFADSGKTIIFSAMTVPEFEGGNLDLYISHLEDSLWSQPKRISPVINSEKNEDSPYLSPDGQTLYFSSKGHNSSGGYDFYKSELVNGEWSYPENLGYPMNSAGDDIYLSFTQDGKRGYFSSNRNGGFGGMDIYSFAVDQKTIEGLAHDKKGNPLPDVVITLMNLTDGGEEYTTTDENGVFMYQVDSDKEFKLLGEKDEYFDGHGKVNTLTAEKTVKADLMLEKDPGISIYALVTDKKSGQPLDSVKMSITDNMKGSTDNHITDESGSYRRAVADKKLDDRGSYNFTFEREGYLYKTITYNLVFDKEGIYNLHTDMDITLEKVELGQDLSKMIDINPIYFDVGRYNIRSDAAIELDKIVKVMNENPEMVIEIGSHTDSRGSATSNMKLSQKRALASANYIKERITNPDRITGKGYGESRLVNECADGVRCSKEQHQVNRRTEFIIVRLTYTIEDGANN